jgi:hypothetical protein
MADILESRCAEQSVGDGVAENVGIRVTGKREPLRVLEGHASKDEGSVGPRHLESMNVIADAAACDHGFGRW